MYYVLYLMYALANQMNGDVCQLHDFSLVYMVCFMSTGNRFLSK